MTEDKKEQPLSYESAIAEILKKQKQNNETATEEAATDKPRRVASYALTANLPVIKAALTPKRPAVNRAT